MARLTDSLGVRKEKTKNKIAPQDMGSAHDSLWLGDRGWPDYQNTHFRRVFGDLAAVVSRWARSPKAALAITFAQVPGIDDDFRPGRQTADFGYDGGLFRDGGLFQPLGKMGQLLAPLPPALDLFGALADTSHVWGLRWNAWSLVLNSQAGCGIDF